MPTLDKIIIKKKKLEDILASDKGNVDSILSAQIAKEAGKAIGQTIGKRLSTEIKKSPELGETAVVPGPGGGFLAGEGEFSPGAGTTLKNAVTANPSSPAPGIFAGLKEGGLGMPQSNVGQFPGQEGRTTAYYAGKMLGDVVRSKIGINTAGEESKLAMVTPGTPQYQEALSGKNTLSQMDTGSYNLLQQELATIPEADLVGPNAMQKYRELLLKYPAAKSFLNEYFGFTRNYTYNFPQGAPAGKYNLGGPTVGAE